MSYESADRELESMNDFIEKKHDPDYGWIDVWDDEANAIARELQDQYKAEDILTEEMKIWTIKFS